MFKNLLITVLMFLLILPVAMVKASDFHGVCVGISEYPSPNQLPDDCVWDAIDMRDILVIHQGWVYGNMILKLDAQATEVNIKNAISAMPRSSGHTDMFFFSGHGTTSGLVTVDEKYLSPSELQTKFCSSYNQYCSFLDACHSGVFPDYMWRGVISASCKANEVSYCGGPDGHSVFTAYLCRGLKNSAADPDGIVSAEELHNYAAPKTTAYKPSMHPQLGDNYPGDLGLCAVPLSVRISGPILMTYGFKGRFWATASGGSSEPVYYRWCIRRDEGSILKSFGDQLGDDDLIQPRAAPPGSWICSYGNNYKDIVARYNFSIKCIVADSEGATATSDILYVTVEGGPRPSVKKRIVCVNIAPKELTLKENYPNPCNPTTTIEFGLPETRYVEIFVYSLTGKKVATMVDGIMQGGYHQVKWDGKDSSGKQLTSGIYFYQINSGGKKLVRKMILAK